MHTFNIMLSGSEEKVQTEKRKLGYAVPNAVAAIHDCLYQKSTRYRMYFVQMH